MTVVPLVLVHGTRTSATIWDHQVAAMTRAGHPCTAVDLPGHGTRTAERFTARAALQVIDDAVAGTEAPPLLVGLSLGGYLALAYAARTRRPLAGLVLAGCSTEIRGVPLAAYRRAATTLARLTGRTARWQVVDDMLHQMRGYSSIADLQRLTIPVRTVSGRRDPLRVGSRRLRHANPTATHVVLPGAGHDVNTEAPELFDAVLLEALAEVAAPKAREGPSSRL